MTQILCAKNARDSIEGTVACVIRNYPSGLVEPVFDTFEAKIGHAMLSIPATKAFEIGSGFKGNEVPGSMHNIKKEGGGVQGGITHG